MKKSLLISLTGEFLSKFPLFGFEFLLAAKLSLNDYAAWTSLLLIYRFSPYMHLGAISYFNKRYPFVIGKKNTQLQDYIVQRVNKSINSIAFFLVLAASMLLSFSLISFEYFVVIVSVSIVQLYTYSQAKLRNEGDFFHYVIGLLLFSCVQLLCAFLLIDVLGLWGAVASVFMGYVVSVAYYLKFGRLNFIWSVAKYRPLFKILNLGFAPFLLTISAFLLQVGDRIALFFVGEPASLAFYGFFAIFMQLGIVAVNSIGKVLGPYIIERVGREGAKSTMRLCVYNTYIIFFMYVVFFFGCFLFGDFIVAKLFPKFAGSMLGVLSYGTVGFLLAVGLTFYPQLIAVNKEKMIIYLNFVSAVILVLVVYFAAMISDGYKVFALASLLVNFFIIFVFIGFLERKLAVNLRAVKLIVTTMTMNTGFVGLYVWS